MAKRKNWLTAALLVSALTGCAEEKRPEPAACVEPSAELAQDFDAAATGTLQGTVQWQGPPPSVPGFAAYPDLGSQPDMPPWGVRDNPLAPRIAGNRGVAQAVIFLKKVELRRSRPWDHGPVLVEHNDWRLQIHQGETVSAIGFVRRGGCFRTVNKQKALHILHGEGSAFFSMPLPEPDHVSTRRLDQAGQVDLSSGADYFWMRGHLFVDDHPYYTRSDDSGRFVLSRVPAGTCRPSLDRRHSTSSAVRAHSWSRR